MANVYYPQCLATLHVVFDGFGGTDSSATTFTVRPKTASALLNGYREADTFALEFDASYFPFSPELIRSMGVEIHMYRTDGLGGAGTSQHQKNPYYELEEDNLVVAGLVDDARYHAGKDGRTFSVTGRDYTCLMLDKPWDPTKRFPVGLPLDQAVQNLVDEATGAAAHGRVMTVKVIGSDSTPVIAATGTKSSALVTAGKYHVSKKGKITIPGSGKGNIHTNKKGVPVKGGSSYWDVIYRQCIRLGLICFVRGTDVIISTPSTLTEATSGRLRSVAYGQDLSTLDIDRKLGKEKVPQIEVVCYDPESMASISAKYPASAKEITTGIGTKKDETRQVVVHGITDQGQLAKLAKLYYDNLARSEGTIKFGTKDLTDLNGNDLLFLRPGDPVQLGFDGITEDFRQMAEFERFEALLSMGYNEQVAGIIAIEFDKINQFRVPFYTKDVGLTWSSDSGLSIEVSALNYIAPGRDDSGK